MRILLRNKGSSSTPSKLEPSYDVVILGGGPAGLAAAVSVCSKLDLRVLVAEAQAPGHERVGESCPPDIILLLERLGLAADFRKSGHAPCPGYASSWGRPRIGYNDFIVNPFGPAWRLNRRAFDHMMATAAAAHGAQLAWRLRFQGVEEPTVSGTCYRLHFSHSRDSKYSTTATFVIDATGSKARFAKALGINKRIDDQLFAQVQFAHITSGDDPTQRIVLEATPGGWWYTTMLPGRKVVSMMVTEKNNLRMVKQDDCLGYQKALNATSFVGPALARLSLTDIRYQTLPIHSGILEQMEGNGWMAIGDAASSYDPVMAQGIYKALADGVAAGKTIASFFNDGGQLEDSYSRHIKNRYQRYLQAKAHIYSLEQRWPDAPFWRNRHRIELKRPLLS